MKKMYALFVVLSMPLFSGPPCCPERSIPYNDVQEIPLLEDPVMSEWEKTENVAQYKMSDWSHVVGRAQNVTPREAMQIAANDPRITYFFFVKGYQLVLENYEVSPSIFRVFHQGDAVFFSGEPTWGKAPGLADGYVKRTFHILPIEN